MSFRWLDYGFNGYRVPVFPRAPRSVGGRKKQTFDVKPFMDQGDVMNDFLQVHESSSLGIGSESKNFAQLEMTRGHGSSFEGKAQSLITNGPIYKASSSHDAVIVPDRKSLSPVASCQSFSQAHRHCDRVNILGRNDDENFVRSIKSQATGKFPKRWRVPGTVEGASKLRADSCLDRKSERDFQNSWTHETNEISESMYPFKKRKFYHNSIDISTGHQITPEPKDCNVKLSIKSLKVPELFIDIPLAATVGSLKRTVMEAVTSALGEGIHVGILLHGKKVRDDNKTLLQTGISHNYKPHRLGFTLEPSHAKITSPPCDKEEDLTRINSGDYVHSETNLTPSFANPISMDALALVPFHDKPGYSKFI